jgi:hypothetical protein
VYEYGTTAHLSKFNRDFIMSIIKRELQNNGTDCYLNSLSRPQTLIAIQPINLRIAVS